MTTETAVETTPDVPGALPAGTVTAAVISEDLRQANTVASQANSVTAIYGLSGSGKSGLGDTAAVYAAKTYGATTLCYAADLGGWGNKRLALIRAGVLKVWDPRNHINPFATMEYISLGAWPEVIDDPERGYARPDVKLVLPRSLRYQVICANGHTAATLDDAASAARVNVLCGTCGVQVTATTAGKIVKSIIKPALFKNVGFRLFDSLTALSDWGLLQELPRMASENELPRNSSGGSLLGSATALTSGEFNFGSGSQAQVGFMQNRAYVWLANIRSIPDQVIPSVVVFGVEKSKGDDESGGEQILGPKIAGNARTSSVPGWVGNCLHASKEPQSNAPGAPLVYRLWLTNHIDPRDPRKVPYLAKHRGTPDGMPEYLEDPLPATPGDASKAWSVFNLGVFFGKLQEQLQREEARLAEELGGEALRKIAAASADAQDEVVGAVQEGVPVAQPVRGPVAGARPVAGRPAAAAPAVSAPAVTPQAAKPVAGARPIAGARPAGAPAGANAVQVAVAVTPAVITPTTPVAATAGSTAGVAAGQAAGTSAPPRVTRPVARVAPRPPVS